MEHNQLLIMANLALVVVAALLAGTAALKVTISPANVHLSPGEPLTVRSTADSPLTHCQLKLWWLSHEPPTDLSEGAASNNANVTYVGDGLAAGHCGATIGPAILPYHLQSGAVELRVRSAGSDWEYAFMVWTSTNQRKISLTTTESRLVVVPAGGRVNLLWLAEEPLTICKLYRPQLGVVNIHEYRTCWPGQDSLCYYGQGLGQHQCGATVRNITDAFNGIFYFLMGNREGFETDYFRVIVAKPPDTPVLTGNTTLNPDGTTSLQAVCTVSGSRPASNITWLLDGEVITSGSVVHLVDDRWVGVTDNQTSVQLLTLTLEADADNRDLVCVAHHVALTKPIRSNKFRIVYPGCGRRNTNKVAALVSGGNVSIVGEFPWHMAVYYRYEGDFTLWCGGTLIRANIVISAAHCFWNETSIHSKPPSEFKVAGGKHLRQWNDTSTRVQKRDVEAIILRPLYLGRVSSFASDIAIVRMTSPFDINTVVNVACVDWGNQLESSQLVPGNMGVVAGWGFTQDKTLSDTLKHVALPYVTLDVCRAAVSRDLRHLLTHGDKFCAGFVNKTTGVCGGDSGGGLLFLDDVTGKYFLRGVVSVGFTPRHVESTCYAENVSGFTLVSHFIGWIKENV